MIVKLDRQYEKEYLARLGIHADIQVLHDMQDQLSADVIKLLQMETVDEGMHIKNTIEFMLIRKEHWTHIISLFDVLQMSCNLKQRVFIEQIKREFLNH